MPRGGNGGGRGKPGGGGDDGTIKGTKNDDVLIGTDGDDIFNPGLGNDQIFGEEGSDTVTYAWIINSSFGIVADLEADSEFGTVTYNQFKGKNSGPFTDKLYSIENIVGSQFGDDIFGDDGNNTLDGQGGRDILDGRGGDDILIGGESDDRLNGGAGDDTLTGDTLTSGGGGVDVFIFEGAFGNDTITDFEDGIDLLDLEGTGLSFTDLSISASDSDTLIEDGLGNSITLTGIDSSLITVDDFFFG